MPASSISFIKFSCLSGLFLSLCFQYLLCTECSLSSGTKSKCPPSHTSINSPVHAELCHCQISKSLSAPHLSTFQLDSSFQIWSDKICQLQQMKDCTGVSSTFFPNLLKSASYFSCKVGTAYFSKCFQRCNTNLKDLVVDQEPIASELCFDQMFKACPTNSSNKNPAHFRSIIHRFDFLSTVPNTQQSNMFGLGLSPFYLPLLSLATVLIVSYVFCLNTNSRRWLLVVFYLEQQKIRLNVNTELFPNSRNPFD